MKRDEQAVDEGVAAALAECGSSMSGCLAVAPMLGSFAPSIWEQSTTCGVCASDVERLYAGGWCVLSAVARHRGGTVLYLNLGAAFLVFRVKILCANCLPVDTCLNSKNRPESEPDHLYLLAVLGFCGIFESLCLHVRNSFVVPNDNDIFS